MKIATSEKSVAGRHDLRDVREPLAVVGGNTSTVLDERVDQRELSQPDRGLHRAHVVAPSLTNDVVVPHPVVRPQRPVRVDAEQPQLTYALDVVGIRGHERAALRAT